MNKADERGAHVVAVAEHLDYIKALQTRDLAWREKARASIRLARDPAAVVDHSDLGQSTALRRSSNRIAPARPFDERSDPACQLGVVVLGDTGELMLQKRVLEPPSVVAI